MCHGFVCFVLVFFNRKNVRCLKDFSLWLGFGCMTLISSFIFHWWSFWGGCGVLLQSSQPTSRPGASAYQTIGHTGFHGFGVRAPPSSDPPPPLPLTGLTRFQQSLKTPYRLELPNEPGRHELRHIIIDGSNVAMAWVSTQRVAPKRSSCSKISFCWCLSAF